MNFLVNWSQGPDRSLGRAIENTITNSFPKSLIPLARKFSKRAIPNYLFKSKLVLEYGINPNSPLNALSEIGWDRALASRLRYALTIRGLNELLRNVDRNSMRWSIESRVPFLTTDFAEFVLTLPEHGLVSNTGVTKNYFRKAMVGIVPNQILERKDKIGFETPELDWLKLFKEDVGTWLEGLSEIPWIDIDGAKIYFQDVLVGNKNFSWQVWRLINAAKWSQLVLN
jgi:asparagine synthase (glutamine-hydrolysing)